MIHLSFLHLSHIHFILLFLLLLSFSHLLESNIPDICLATAVLFGDRTRQALQPQRIAEVSWKTPSERLQWMS